MHEIMINECGYQVVLWIDVIAFIELVFRVDSYPLHSMLISVE